MSARRRATALSSCVLGSVVVAASCRDATQLTVRVTSGESCTELSDVELVVGPDPKTTQERFQQRVASAVSSDCDASGVVGTLVITPGGERGTIVVAAGVRVKGEAAPDPATCSDPAVAPRCIIARRSFAFLDHTSLSLPIRLDPLCVGQACDPASTCFKGACVDATAICTGADCGLAVEHPGEGTGDGNDAGSSDGSYDAPLDATGFEDVLDSAVTTDAQADADGSSSTAPPCAMSSGKYYCSGSVPGTVTMNKCSELDPNPSCCRCTCPNGTETSCGVSGPGSSCSNLMPVCL